jgi:hypothetical protein
MEAFLAPSREYETADIGCLPRFARLGTDRRPAPSGVARHDRMVAWVEQMLALHWQLAAARTPPERTVLQNQIDATDAQIDRLVYELYGLTDAEIAIVEGSARATISG